jgi:hypothetical protein
VENLHCTSFCFPSTSERSKEEKENMKLIATCSHSFPWLIIAKNSYIDWKFFVWRANFLCEFRLYLKLYGLFNTHFIKYIIFIVRLFTFILLLLFYGY